MAQHALDKKRKLEEIRRETDTIQAELQKARADGQPTAMLEANLETLDERVAELKRNPAQDPNNPAWTTLRAKTASIRQITEGGRPVSIEDARHLVEMLYTDIDPKVNGNLQLATFNRIQQCSEGGQLSSEARTFLRDSVLDYYHATLDQCDGNTKGPMCNPYSLLFLAQSIAAVANPEDAEAISAFQHLKTGVTERCAALQWEREQSLFAEPLSRAEDTLTLKDEDIRGVTELVGTALGEEDIGKLLRNYRRVLRAPPRRVKPEVAAIIDRNLFSLSQRDLSRKNWELWADVTITLGPQRASPQLREYVSLHKDVKEASKSVALGKVWKAFGRSSNRG